MTTDKNSEKTAKPVDESKLAKNDKKETDPKAKDTKKPVEEVEDLVII